MRTIFTTGIQGPRYSFWMGQVPQQVYAATVEDIIAQGLKSGAEAYGTYGRIEVAEETTEAKQAEAAAREAAARTAQIMQQTQAITQQTIAERDKIMGIDKTAFFVGATLLGLMALGGTFYLVSKG